MKQKVINIFVAEDGREFKAAADCQEYETGAMLEHNISSNILTEYAEDYEAEVITPRTIAQYITDNWEFLQNVLKK